MGLDGYGSAHYGPKDNVHPAHRVSYEISTGKPIPEGEDVCVLHTCRNRVCVNPNHLYLGTRKDNALQAKAEGRLGVRGGEESHAHLLTWNQVYEILAKHASGVGYRKLSKEYNVGINAIRSVVKRETWKHPPENH